MKKVMWANYDDIIPGDVIEDVNFKLVDVFNVNKKDQDEIINIIENNLIEGGSRCIRVFRDCIYIGDDVYDVCLSCSDVLVKGKTFHLNSEDKNRLIEIKKNYLNYD